jgi:seryl-tRNA synthetase
MPCVRPPRPRTRRSISTGCWRLDGEVRGLKTRIDELRRQRNEISAEFKTADPAERPALGAKAKAFGAEAAQAETALAERSAELEALMLGVPNIPWEGAPVGPDESFNTIVRRKARRRASISSRSTMSRWPRRTTGRTCRGSPRWRARECMR